MRTVLQRLTIPHTQIGRGMERKQNVWWKIKAQTGHMAPCKDCEGKCCALHPLTVSCTFAYYMKRFTEIGTVRIEDDFAS